MGKHSLNGPRDCKNTDKVITVISHAPGWTIAHGHGDHIKFTAPDGRHFTAYSKKELSIGVAHGLYKFLQSYGLVITFVGLGIVILVLGRLG